MSLSASTTPAVEVDITDPGSVADRLTDAVDDLLGSVIERLPLLILAFVVLVVGLLLVGLIHRGIVRATGTGRIDRSVAALVRTMSRIFFVVVVLLLSLSVAGVDVTSALAALGLAGLALAFAVQSTLENFIAGVLILIRRPFRAGDQVRLGEFDGTVQDINLRVTTIVDYDGEKILIPNAMVFNAPIINTTERGRRRTRVRVGIDYRDDHEAARAVLLAALTATKGVLPSPAPQVLIVEFGESSVDMSLQYWTEPEQTVVNAVRSRVLSSAKIALEEAGMTIPWPIRTLVVDADQRA